MNADTQICVNIMLPLLCCNVKVGFCKELLTSTPPARFSDFYISNDVKICTAAIRRNLKKN
jgi:hypothetical protein